MSKKYKYFEESNDIDEEDDFDDDSFDFMFSSRNRENKRRFKGDSLLEFPDDYTVIDIESTGTNILKDYIIELAAVRVRNNQEVAAFSSLVKPPVSIPKKITNITGISDDTVSEAPAVEEVLPSFIEFIGNDIILGHNVHFDVNKIYDLWEAQTGDHVSNNIVDTLRLAKHILKLDRYALQDVACCLDVPYVGAHRSLNDCRITIMCYKKLKERKNELSNESLQENTQPALHKKSYEKIDYKAITPECSDIDTSCPICGKKIVISGSLSSYTRAEALQMIVNHGGIVAPNVTRTTDFLVIGSYEGDGEGYKSTKAKAAEKLISEGFSIRIISEKDFLIMLNISQ